ncbi:hypothetical protein HPOKI673_07795 [Helicobacter pylori oki673]|nr:hypothetical protein HPOKI673_07795 [Helicobacter pylori oki673]
MVGVTKKTGLMIKKALESETHTKTLLMAQSLFEAK